jgi:tRNA guanosine-2'-O-methyltransferase
LFILYPSLIQYELLPKFALYENRPTLLASLAIVASFVLRSLPLQAASKLFEPILSRLYPLLASNFGHARLATQYCFWIIVKELDQGKFSRQGIHYNPQSDSESNSSFTMSSFTSNELSLYNMFHHLETNEDAKKLRERQQIYFQHFHPLQRCTVKGIFYNQLDQHYFIPKPLLDQLSEIVRDHLTNIRGLYDQDYADATEGKQPGEPMSMLTAAQVWKKKNPEQKNREEEDEENNQSGATGGFQQKIEVNTLESLMELFDRALITQEQNQVNNQNTGGTFVGAEAAGELLDSDVIENTVLSLREIRSLERTDRHRFPFIFIASLLDKTPNFGALCRTSEIFNLESLCLPNKEIIQDWHFRRIAVTADRWQPMEVLAPQFEDIQQYINKKKQQGYTICAIEQTRDSVKLGEFEFPERVVCLLGAEKLGIPVEMLALVDYTIEIPQFGLVRSLNVHVSASMIAWEYVKQRTQKS